MRKRLCFAALVVVALTGLCLYFGRGSDPVRTEARVSPKSLPTVSPNVAAVKASVPLPAVPALTTNQTPTVRGTLPYVLTSVAPFGMSLRLEAEAMGAKTVSVLSRHALLVEATDAVRTRLLADGRFSKVEEFGPSGKIQPRLAKLVAGGAASVEVSIVSLAAEDRARVQASLENGGGEMLTGCINEGATLRARVPSALVAELARRGDVRWMETFVRPQIMNDLSVEPPLMNVRTVWNTHGLTGRGQSISTSDTGIDTGNLLTLHQDLREQVKDIKVVEFCDRKDSNGHGTHTAGSIVGNGKMSDGKIKGTAYEANLYAWFCSSGDGGVSTPTNMNMLYRGSVDSSWPTFIHSASWGASVYGEYTSMCAEHDKYVWEHPDFLPVFSAGNDGSGKYTIGAPGSAKNVLTVGATQSTRPDHDGGWGNGDPTATAAFSSRGPCQDGRIKPDIAAPGVGTLSTRSSGVNYSYGIYDEYYAYDSGTSMSCPLTAGSVALVRQWLVEKKGFDADATKPTAALLKAVITGGAKGVTKPNTDQGWGRVDLEETLFPSGGRDVKLVDRIPFAEGAVFEYLVETTNAAPLDVQLCWIDYPGDGIDQSQSQLVNDLDLTVETLGSVDPVLYGNGGESADRYNNMESVRIPSAVPNKYLITVTCSRILYTDGGAAALYICGAFDPEAQPTGLDRVRIRRNAGVTYRTLDQALAKIQGGDVVEVLDTVGLRAATTITNSVTILATNAVASASAVTAAGALMLENDVRVLFTNVVFGGVSPILKVGNGCTAALGGSVGLDQIVLAANGVLELAGELDGTHAYFVTPGKGHVLAGETFGKASVGLETAQQFARFFVNTVDCELIGEAVDDGQGGVALRWVKGEVPEAATGATLTQDGKTVRFANLQVLAKYVTNDAAVVVTKDCYFDGALTTGVHTVTICSTNAAVVTPKTSAGNDAFASLTVNADGSLSVSNVVFSGFSQFGEASAFVVVEKGGTFRMLPGAELREIAACETAYGAVLLNGGEMTMANGTRIVDCSADGGSGGGVCLAAKGARLDVCGAEISGCWATVAGGGVYLASDAKLNLSGAVRIAGNERRGEYNAANASDDDIYAAGKTPAGLITVTDVTDGASVGIYTTGKRENLIGTAFATLNGAVSEETAASVFFHDVYHGYSDGLVGSAGDGTLVWAATEVAPGSVPESEATVRVEIGGVTNFYDQLSLAFGSVTTDDTATVTLLTNVLMDADIAVAGNVTLDGTRGNGSVWRIYQGAADSNRDENRYFTVKGAGTSLCLTNVFVVGTDVTLSNYYAYGTLFKVSAGADLTLEKGGRIDYVVIADDKYWPITHGLRSAPAVDVSGGARLTMKSGADVGNCWNYPKEADSENTTFGAGVGASGDGTVVRMEGGRVSGCNAYSGAGLFVENGAQIVVSGDAEIVCNTNVFGLADNLYLSDGHEGDGRCVVLTNVFTGRIGCTRGATTTDSETNVFGTVSTNWSWGAVALTNSAARFVNDATGAIGVAVTNGEETLLVWKTALVTDESGSSYYEDKDGNRYGLVTGDDPVPPTPTPEPTPVTVGPIDFKSITRVSDAEWTLVITNRVQYCGYRLLWTEDLAKGFTATGGWETATADGEWTTNVLFSAPVPSAVFWKAEGKDGEKQTEE